MSRSDNVNEPEAAIVELLIHAGALKRLPRQGWLHIGVENPESVADHSYQTALMTLLMAQHDPSIDVSRALVLAICHDLPEAIAGDATPFDATLEVEGVDRDLLFRSPPSYSEDADRAKRAAEESALDEMTARLPDQLRRLIVDAWEEYEAGYTAEARFVRQIDKLEALLQAREYRANMPDLRVESFELGARERVCDPDLRRLMQTFLDIQSDSDEPAKR